MKEHQQHIAPGTPDAGSNAARAAALEALLFAHGEPLNIKILSETAQCTTEETVVSLKELAQSLHGRGVMLMERNKAYQLVTRPEYGTFVTALRKRDLDGPLTRPQLETLAVVAYRGPVQKSEIDYVRGVNSAFTLRTLVTRGLIDRATRTAEGDRASRYRISDEFLYHLGITAVTDLPSYAAFHDTSSTLQQTRP